MNSIFILLMFLLEMANASPKPHNAYRAGRHIDEALSIFGGGFLGGNTGKPSNAPSGVRREFPDSQLGQPPTNTYGAPGSGGFNSGPARGPLSGTQAGRVGGGGFQQVGNGGLSVGLLGEAARLLTGGLSVGLEGGISHLGKGLALPNFLGSLPSVDGANNCICPESNGWSNEQILQNQRQTNISAGRFDCYCIGRAGFVLIKRGPGGVRVSNGNPGPSVGSGGVAVGSNSGSYNLNGADGGYVNGGYSAGASRTESSGSLDTLPRTTGGNSGGTIQNSRPTMSCFCPKPSGWTYNQLNLLLRQRNFSGGVSDCYCGNPSEIPSELSEQLRSFRTGSSSGSIRAGEAEESHLSIVSLDGDLREVRLGPLLVNLT